MNPPPLPYTPGQSHLASEEWDANCGPHSLAAALNKPLDEIRKHLAGYRGFMNPTQVSQALVSLGVVHNFTSRLKTMALCNGINRIQWEGKWLNPGVPARVAYRHTHYVAHFDGWVLCTGSAPDEWQPAKLWASRLIVAKSPFHITHHWSFPHPAAEKGTQSLTTAPQETN